MAQAAASGLPVSGLLPVALECMLEATGADRAGVWLEERGGNEGTFSGAVQEVGAGETPPEWNCLAVSLPYLRPLFDKGDAVEQRLPGDRTMPLFGPLVEMRRAIWVPVRLAGRTIGLVLAASRQPRRLLSAAPLERVAVELALAVARERGANDLQELQREMALLRWMQAEMLRDASPADALRVAMEAFSGSHGTAFLAIGEGAEVPLRFGWFAGSAELEVSLGQPEVREVWRRALEDGRVVGADAARLGPNTEEVYRVGGVSRVVALPLAAAGRRLGVMVAGLTPGGENLTMLERLETRAAVAALAIAREQQRDAEKRAAVARHAWLEATCGWILELDANSCILGASRSARKALSLPAEPPGRVRLEELFAEDSRGVAASWAKSAAAGDTEALAAGMEARLTDGTAIRVLPQQVPGAAGRWSVRVEKLPASRPGEAPGHTDAELEALLDSLETGVLLFDAEGKLRGANSRFSQITTLDGRKIRELGTAPALARELAGQFADPAGFARRSAELEREQEVGSWDELEMVRPVRRFLERYARPVTDRQGRRAGWIEIYRDITGQRVFQSQLLQTEKLAALGQFASGIAHELNNPLTSILGYAQLLHSRVRGTNPEADADVEKICQEAERAGRIVRNLLRGAREGKPERRSVDLNDVVERMLALRSYEWTLENIRVDRQLAPELPEVAGNADQLQQVVINLMLNAEQAIASGRGRGTIRVRTCRTDAGRVALEVTDDGPGIPPGIATRIFDLFFTTKPAGVGTGLGLSIVSGIVREHGGEVRVNTPPGGGATFVVELPAAAVGEEQVKKVAAARGQHILVVEDEPTVAELITDVLEQEGHRVEALCDSREALARAREQDFDLVICDLKMPHLDGRDFFGALESVGSPLQEKILFVTGDTLGGEHAEVSGGAWAAVRG